jgi:SAM-dependent methyltransferase
MPRELDSLTSLTLKHLRDQWWTQSFTDFLVETLRPRAGKRILDVGCGSGIAEASLSRQRLSQVKFYGVDLVPERARAAAAAARGMNASAAYAAADAVHLPFRDAAFDSAYCVAVLQHVGNVAGALRELARVTRPGGLILVVEPDNSARYWFSSVQSGRDAFEIAQRFFAALASARGESPAAQTGPLIPGMFTREGIEPVSVHVFPVTVSHLGTPESHVWEARREAVRQEIERAPGESLRRLGADVLKVIDQYAHDAAAAGAGFVEIQNTMLFATVGRRADAS